MTERRLYSLIKNHDASVDYKLLKSNYRYRFAVSAIATVPVEGLGLMNHR
jgi:hypothetical protein